MDVPPHPLIAGELGKLGRDLSVAKEFGCLLFDYGIFEDPRHFAPLGKILDFKKKGFYF